MLFTALIRRLFLTDEGCLIPLKANTLICDGVQAYYVDANLNKTAFSSARSAVTTTDATVTTIVTIPIIDDTAVFVDTQIAGQRTDAADRAAYELKALVFRAGGGGATIQGPVDTTFSRESVGAYDANISVSGNDALVTVRGQTGHTINWTSAHLALEAA